MRARRGPRTALRRLVPHQCGAVDPAVAAYELGRKIGANQRNETWRRLLGQLLSLTDE